MDEERMRTSNWLGLVLCVSLSALTLMIGWQEVHPSHNNTISLTFRGSVQEQLEKDDLRGNQLTQFTCIKAIELEVIGI